MGQILHGSARTTAAIRRAIQDSQLREHLANFVATYNFGKRFKTLKRLTPYEFICKCWTKQAHRFTSDPHNQIPGPNI